MTEEPKSFSVKDRRLFTPEGDVRRSEHEGDPAPGATTPVESRAADEPAPPAPLVADDVATHEDSDEGELPADLIGLLVSFATQGVEALSASPPRLREARGMVALLEMLRDKTEGRRNAEEERALDTLLYQLRMAYLERSRVGGA
jgi:hypothetical protein